MCDSIETLIYWRALWIILFKVFYYVSVQHIKMHNTDKLAFARRSE